MSARERVRQTLKRTTPRWVRQLAWRTAGPVLHRLFPAPADAPDIAALKRQLQAMPWFHSIDLGGGVLTPGREPTAEKLARLHMPRDLTGKSVLDVGAYDGFFSFEAERRDAARVLATDRGCWGGTDPYGGRGAGSRACFDWACGRLGSRVEARVIDVFDLSPETVGRFDLVLFLGVLYHMRHPLLALERVAGVAADMLILETHVDMLHCRRPAMAFYPGTEPANDPTTWCGPNPPMVEAMLRTVGFRTVKQIGRVCRRRRSPRAVFHAWR
jgi:tRNA (mo5U34)-methyltransferase